MILEKNFFFMTENIRRDVSIFYVAIEKCEIVSPKYFSYVVSSFIPYILDMTERAVVNDGFTGTGDGREKNFRLRQSFAGVTGEVFSSFKVVVP